MPVFSTPTVGHCISSEMQILFQGKPYAKFIPD
jgi:hypothetical protein